MINFQFTLTDDSLTDLREEFPMAYGAEVTINGKLVVLCKYGERTESHGSEFGGTLQFTNNGGTLFEAYFDNGDIESFRKVFTECDIPKDRKEYRVY